MKRFGRRGIAALIMLAGLGGSMSAQPATDPAGAKAQAGIMVKVDPRTKALIVPLGGTVKFEPDLGNALPKDVTVQNEQIIQARLDPTSPKQFIMTGSTPGLTRISILTSDNRRIQYDVVVEPDFEQLRNVIKRTLPTASVDIVPGVGTSVILTGFVNKPEDAALVERIATAAVQAQSSAQGGGAGAGGAPGGAVQQAQVINAIQIGGNQHVQIEVVVASVNRTELRSRGFDFTVNGTQVNVSSIVSNLIVPGAAGAAPGVSGQANLQVGVVPAQFFGALRALRTEGLAKFLTEPKLVTQSGRPANILAGGRQAVIAANAGLAGPGVTLENVGTEVDVLPIVMGNGKIYLDVFPRIRAVNNGRGITTNFGFTPGFDEQSARAAVVLESGQTFAIGGLIESSTQANTSKVPFLGDLPFVGTAFSRIDHDERETELVILVTPRLAEPMDCNQLPKRVPGRETRSPDDYELFLENLLEAPRGQRRVWNGHCYNAAHKCDANGYPCVGNVCGGTNGTCGTAGCQTGGCAAAPAAGMMKPMAAMPTPTPTVNVNATPAVLPPVAVQAAPAEQPPVEPAPAVPANTPVNVPTPMVDVPVPAVPPVQPVIPPAPEAPAAPTVLPTDVPQALPPVK